jgi:hypothetical protein
VESNKKKDEDDDDRNHYFLCVFLSPSVQVSWLKLVTVRTYVRPHAHTHTTHAHTWELLFKNPSRKTDSMNFAWVFSVHRSFLRYTEDDCT